MEIVNIEAGTFREMTTSIRLLKEKLENLKSRQTSKSLDDWMDNQEVCMALNISQRTLQVWRALYGYPTDQPRGLQEDIPAPQSRNFERAGRNIFRSVSRKGLVYLILLRP